MLWYLAHPVAGDDQYTYEQNMEHAKKVYVALLRAGLKVCAPWILDCMVLDDSIPEERALGMENDAAIYHRCDGIILTGHKLSRGMEREFTYFRSAGKRIIGFIGISLDDILSKIRDYPQ